MRVGIGGYCAHCSKVITSRVIAGSGGGGRMLSGAPLQEEQRPPCYRENHPDQATADCVEAEAMSILAEEFDLHTAVVVNEENILVRQWRITALNNAVRLTRNDDSGHARHADNLPLAGRKVNK